MHVPTAGAGRGRARGTERGWLARNWQRPLLCAVRECYTPKLLLIRCCAGEVVVAV
jgi:hypothetical protein